MAGLAANPVHDAAIRDLTTRAVEFVHDLVVAQPGYRGIVLTGAPARGEGTAITSSRGIRVLSDVDLMVVFDDTVAVRAARRSLVGAALRANDALRPYGLTAHVDYAPVTLDGLRSMGASMFAMEFAAFARVVDGPNDLLADVPSVTAPQIPREDALLLLANRVIGQLVFRRDLAGNSDARLFAAYHSGKIACDVLGATLAFRGRYAPTYSERAARVCEVVGEKRGDLPAAFADEARRWTRFKLDPDGDPVARDLAGDDDRRAREAAESLWEAARRWLLAAWQGLGSEYAGGESSRRSIAEALARRERLLGRARSWASLVRHPFFPVRRVRPLSLARNAIRASPGWGASFGAIDLLAGDLESARSRVVIRPRTRLGAQEAGVSDALLEVWHIVMKGGAA